MTPEERRGRTILLWLIGGALFISGGVIGLYIAAKGTDRLPAQIVRFLLRSALMWWLYQGSRVAKWIVVIQLGIAGVAGLWMVLLEHRLAANLGVKLGMFYLTIVGTLLKSSDVNAFLDYQSHRRWESSSDEAVPED